MSLARAPSSWSSRWPALARAAGIEPERKLLLALSGGADSVLLLHWLAAADPQVDLIAVHVDHGLRGTESDEDARFAGALARELGVPFRLVRADLDPHAPSLEARARAERYRLLVREALASGHTTIVTGHHSDDALETLLQRWVRGTALPGLRGPRAALTWHGEGPVEVVRPLLSLRREEVRTLLRERGLAWREDRSNADPAFTRSRVRHGLLPEIERLCGAEGIECLREFGRAVEELEETLARATAPLAWQSAPWAALARGPSDRALGGVLPRAELMKLAPALRRRALWRLLTEGTGRSPRRAVLERILADLADARCTRRSLPGGWTLVLRSAEFHLLPPHGKARADDPRQLRLPFPAAETALRAALAIPGSVTLADGRVITAELRPAPPEEPVPTSGFEAELDAEGLPDQLFVRWPEHGDRFRGLGAPGSKPLARFLADRGIPREERAHIPLVGGADEILWVAGLAPCERRRVRPRTLLRLRLALS